MGKHWGRSRKKIKTPEYILKGKKKPKNDKVRKRRLGKAKRKRRSWIEDSAYLYPPISSPFDDV